MVVIIPKKRQCRRYFNVGGLCVVLAIVLVVCYTTGTGTGLKMTAWSDFVGEGADGLEGGRSSIFPRSLSLYNYQKTSWSDDANTNDGGVANGRPKREIAPKIANKEKVRINIRSSKKDVAMSFVFILHGDSFSYLLPWPVLVCTLAIVVLLGLTIIRPVPLSIVTSCLSIYSGDDRIDTAIKSHLAICSRPQAQLEHVVSNTSHPYHKMIATGLKAIRTYVPRQYHPKFTNPCWFSSMPGLPGPLHRNFTEYRGCMPNAMETYTEQRAYEIVRLSVTTPANGAKRIMDLLNLTHTADIIPPQCRSLADQVSAPSSSLHSSHAFLSVNASRLFKECTYKYKLFCLPKVLLAGFPKCATSSMYYMMIKHPQLAKARMKEEHIWRDSFLNTDIRLPHKQIQMLYYLFHFERASREILMNPDHLTIDGSTTTIVPGLYIPYHQEEDMCIMPRVITSLIPNAKIIIMMRNPADRLYSDYWYLCAKFSWKNGRTVNIPADYIKNATRVFHQMSTRMINNFNRCSRQESVFECVRQAGGYMCIAMFTQLNNIVPTCRYMSVCRNSGLFSNLFCMSRKLMNLSLSLTHTHTHTL